jgi:hypothetical protein
MKRITVISMIAMGFCVGYILAMKDQRKIIHAIEATQSSILDHEINACAKEGGL